MSSGARYLVEFKVEAGAIGDDILDGHCDLFDRATRSVVDWKIVGPAALKRYRARGADQQQQIQVNTYGLGWEARGLRPAQVAIVYLPSAGELSEAVWWRAPYNPEMARAAITRADTIAGLVAAAGPAAPAALPTADAHCTWCPWYLPAATDLAEACPGHIETPRATT